MPILDQLKWGFDMYSVNKKIESRPIIKSLTRGRFKKYFEIKGNYIRFWGMCDITAQDYQIMVPADVFNTFLQCVDKRSYKNIREILKNMPVDDQRFLLDGITPKGWMELVEAIESIGITEPLFYSNLSIKKVTLKNRLP